MKNNATTKSINKDTHKTSLERSGPKQVGKFAMQVGMEPYSQLGTGERCKVKRCDQPVYNKKSGLCSYHRMKQAEKIFEVRLRARQQQSMIEGNTG
jgi:hypothetical protein